MLNDGRKYESFIVLRDVLGVAPPRTLSSKR
jgi:hypothetical protein